MIISALIDYFRSNYQETNEEKTEKKFIVSYLHCCYYIKTKRKKKRQKKIHK